MKKQTQQTTSYSTSPVFLTRGFTFVETLVAIAVLLIAVVAPLSLVYQSLAASRVARNQVIATYLAEEAIEFIRATRDANALSGNDWLAGLGDCVSEDGCYIDIPDADVNSCTGECPLLQYDPETYLYGYGNDMEDTVFHRIITIEETQPDVEIQIQSRLEWTEGTVERNVTIGEYIYNWE